MRVDPSPENCLLMLGPDPSDRLAAGPIFPRTTAGQGPGQASIARALKRSDARKLMLAERQQQLSDSELIVAKAQIPGLRENTCASGLPIAGGKPSTASRREPGETACC